MLARVITLFVGIVFTQPLGILSQEHPAVVTSWGYGPVSEMLVMGHLGLVASGKVLQVIDVSQPCSLEVLGEITLPAVIEGLAPVETGWLAVAAGSGGLWMVSYEDPCDPQGWNVGLAGSVVAVTATPTNAFAVTQLREGDSFELKLTALDISVPSAPVAIGSVSATGDFEDISMNEDTVYLALANGTLLVVDVSDPGEPWYRVDDPSASWEPYPPVLVVACNDGVYMTEHQQGGWEVYANLYSSNGQSTSWMGIVSDMECAGDHLVLADRVVGALVFDITSGPIGAGGYQMWDARITDVELAGDYLFLADQYSGIYTIDALELPALSDIGTLDFAGQTREMVLAGHYLYCTGLESGLTIVDVQDPARPNLVVSMESLGTGRSVAVSGHHVLVAAPFGVQIIDVDDPEAPLLTSTIATVGDARWVLSAGSFALTIADTLQVFDLSNPNDPIEVASLPVTGVPYMEGGRLLLGSHDGLRIIDVSDPSHPSVLGWYEKEWQPIGSFVTSLITMGDVAYVASGTGSREGTLYSVNIIDAGAPSLIAATDIGALVFDMAPSGDFLLATVSQSFHEAGSIRSYDIRDPGDPILVGTYEPQAPQWRDNTPLDILPAGRIAYVSVLDLGNWDGGVQVVDISEPARLRRAGSLPVPSATTGVAIGGGIAVTTEAPGGLRIFDSADPYALRELGWLGMPTVDHHVVIEGNLAFVGGQGLRVIDLEDATRPREIGAANISAYALQVVGGYAYVASIPTLRIFDVHDPAAPEEVGSYDGQSDYRPEDIAVADSTAFVLLGVNVNSVSSTDIRIVDVSNPTAPTEIAATTCTGRPLAIAVSGHHLFVTTSDWENPDLFGLYIIDVSDPFEPIVVADVTTPGDARGVTVAGDLALVSDTERGVLVLGISDPAAPVELGWRHTGGTANAVAVQGRYAVVADGAGGLTTIDLPAYRRGSRVRLTAEEN